MQVVNMNEDRNAFEAFKVYLKKQQLWKTGMVITQSFLRVNIKLSDTVSNYIVDVKESGVDDALNKQTEQLLKIGDGFYGTHLGIRLYQQLSTDPVNRRLQTYVSDDYFGIAAGTYDPQDLNAIYQGKMSLKVESKVTIENLDMQSFYYAPETQNDATAGTVQQMTELQGLKDMNPYFFLNGKADNQFAIDLPFQNTVGIEPDAANTDNYMVLYIKGLLVKNIGFSTGRS